MLGGDKDTVLEGGDRLVTAIWLEGIDWSMEYRVVLFSGEGLKYLIVTIAIGSQNGGLWCCGVKGFLIRSRIGFVPPLKLESIFGHLASFSLS